MWKVKGADEIWYGIDVGLFCVVDGVCEDKGVLEVDMGVLERDRVNIWVGWEG